MELSSYRAAAVQAGKQPSYGKRQALIPDGLCCPTERFRQAKKLEQPFDSLQTLKEDHGNALKVISLDPQDVVNRRFKTLEMIKSWEVELRVMQQNETRKPRGQPKSWDADPTLC